MRDHSLQLDALESSTQLGERFVVHFRTGGQFVRLELRADELQPLGVIRQRDAEGSDSGMLYDALVQLNLILRDQADGDVSIKKRGITGPALEDYERVAILGGHARNV